MVEKHLEPFPCLTARFYGYYDSYCGTLYLAQTYPCSDLQWAPQNCGTPLSINVHAKTQTLKERTLTAIDHAGKYNKYGHGFADQQNSDYFARPPPNLALKKVLGSPRYHEYVTLTKCMVTVLCLFDVLWIFFKWFYYL